MTYRDITHFLIAIEEVNSPELARQEILRLLAACGIDHFCLFRRALPETAPDAPIMASNWPEGWRSRYVKAGYAAVDPVLRYLPRARQGFGWGQALEGFKGSRQHRPMAEMMQDARAFGLVEGAAFPVHGRFGLAAALSIGGRHCQLSPSEMTLFSAVATRLYWRLCELAGAAGRQAGTTEDIVTLTPRSLEVITLLAEGMTSHEIGSRLNVSSHTVDWHFSNIQQKLKARNRHQTVAMAIRMGLIA